MSNMQNQDNNLSTISLPNLCSGEISYNKISENITEVIVKPLNKGFGLTLGNALRRILLSYLPGCAVTSVKIEGVSHEFSTIPGVKEDMIEIILNLKKIVASPIQDSDFVKVKISPKGPMILTAKHLSVSGVDIANPEHIICNITDATQLDMTITFANGRGFKTIKDVDAMHQEEIGEIMVDTVFNPVKRVAFDVRSARVGNKIGYDELVLEIETNGSIEAKSALDFASKTLRSQLLPFLSFEGDIDNTNVVNNDKISFDPVLLRRVDTLDLSVRSNNCMKNIGIEYIGDLVTLHESDVLKTQNFGRKSLNEIKARLKELNLSFNMVVLGWPPKGDISKIAEEYLKKSETF